MGASRETRIYGTGTRCYPSQNCSTTSMTKEATVSVAIRTGDYGLQVGRPALRSVGPITFGPDGILFVADNAAATIFAIDLQDAEEPRETRPINVEGLDTRLAADLGCPRESVIIRDMAVHPSSEHV